MLAFLMLVAGLHHAKAAVSAIPHDTSYVIKQNVVCSAPEFFFQRDASPNSVVPDICYLCFCQNNNTAVCWRRQNKGCDFEHYQDFGQRTSRTRRSPLSLGEIFVRDAARDFFNKQSPEQCKPFESSFSDGCPPADWCIGCTVCDCDANGRWDCHVLSFCPDKNGKKQMKKHRGKLQKRFSKRQSKTSKTTVSMKVTTKSPNKKTKKRGINPNMRRNQAKQSSAINKQKINQIKSRNVNKFASVKKSLPKVQAKKAIPNRNKVTRRPLYIKKNISTKKPPNKKTNGDKFVKNNTVEVAQKVVKQFMSTMQKMFKNIDKKANKTVNKVVNKRSMPTHDNKNNKKETDQRLQLVAKPAPSVRRKGFGTRSTPKTYNSNTDNYGRSKRQVTIVDDVSRRNGSDFLYKLNVPENVEAKMMQKPTVDNSTETIMTTSHILDNSTANFTQQKKYMNKNMYITDNLIQINDQNSIIKDILFYNYTNKTDSQGFPAFDNNTNQQNINLNKFEDVMFVTTEVYYLSSDISHVNYTNNNRTDLNKTFLEEVKGHENLIFKKGKTFSNVSTQTESHSCKFRTLLQKIIGSNTDLYVNKTETLEALKKPKRYTVLNKIKRLFKQIFNKRNRSKFHHKDDLYYNDFNIKQFDHKKSGNCKLGLREKKKLRQSIIELKNESKSILTTIGIIKGLLHILEINTNDTQFRNTYGSKQNINKLNIILKDTYYMERNFKKLTGDQQTQINYIKDNVQVFIKSIEKFATLLDEIIKLAMCNNKRESKLDNATVNKNTEFNNFGNDYSNTTHIKLQKLRDLILNYNILQNKFIHQIYIILSKLDSNVIVTDKSKSTMRSENYMQFNQTDAIEINSANIITNIRKLKLLADKIKTQKRRKRETMEDDDGLEYLLILMEYLLKRHSPTYSSANDGLDLLIEAIRNAPDIKLTRKKVLHSVTEKALITRTTPKKSLKKYSTHSIREQTNDSLKMNKNIIKTLDQSEDNDDIDEDKIEEIYRSFKSHKDFSSEQKQDDILFKNSNISVTSESYYNLQEEATTHAVPSKDNAMLVNNVVHDSLEEEMTTTSFKTAVEVDTTSVSPATDYSNVIQVDVNLKDQINSNSYKDNFVVDSKANTDWIEENFKEIKQTREVETRSTTPKIVSPTRTYKHSDNLSDITIENKTHNEKKVEPTSAEEIMSKKQLDLLNSLDYVEDDVDSKDDKFSSDTYV